ncbi:MAG TPA: hypothetical protein VM598_13580 [Bdellovibrionota bacterium]|nr:hypothetical protein [Bdellovibrionota bacterium]
MRSSLLLVLIGLSVSTLASPPASAGPAIEAARQVANTDPACTPLAPFYWEIGSPQGPIGGGATGDLTIQAGTSLPIASASKLYFAAYVLEARRGRLTDADLMALRMQLGFVDFGICLPRETVRSCLSRGNNGVHRPRYDGVFHYGGGHFQAWGAANGLASLGGDLLAREYRRMLGSDLEVAFRTPQLAGGMEGSAFTYARFLRRILRGELVLSSRLGELPVCTDPRSCREASSSPADRAWHYSHGHWIEDDPRFYPFDDGSFSSAGAFGFYPWISADRAYYGILSREDHSPGAGMRSAECGQRIRRAFLERVRERLFLR